MRLQMRRAASASCDARARRPSTELAASVAPSRSASGDRGPRPSTRSSGRPAPFRRCRVCPPRSHRLVGPVRRPTPRPGQVRHVADSRDRQCAVVERRERIGVHQIAFAPEYRNVRQPGESRAFAHLALPPEDHRPHWGGASGEGVDHNGGRDGELGRGVECRREHRVDDDDVGCFVMHERDKFLADGGRGEVGKDRNLRLRLPVKAIEERVGLGQLSRVDAGGPNARVHRGASDEDNTMPAFLERVCDAQTWCQVAAAVPHRPRETSPLSPPREIAVTIWTTIRFSSVS